MDEDMDKKDDATPVADAPMEGGEAATPAADDMDMDKPKDGTEMPAEGGDSN